MKGIIQNNKRTKMERIKTRTSGKKHSSGTSRRWMMGPRRSEREGVAEDDSREKGELGGAATQGEVI